jgi:hypothetical protein
MDEKTFLANFKKTSAALHKELDQLAKDPKMFTEETRKELEALVISINKVTIERTNISAGSVGGGGQVPGGSQPK